jgi:predicted nucleic acid-binding protein
MTPCFADTFFFLALVVRKDPKVHEAAAAAHQSGRPMVTTAWVIVELADALCDAVNRPVFDRLYSTLLNSPRVEIIPPDERWLDLGIQRFNSRPDKDWSLTDCISFVVMEHRGLTEALTADHHFEQAGFAALLNARP